MIVFMKMSRRKPLLGKILLSILSVLFVLGMAWLLITWGDRQSDADYNNDNGSSYLELSNLSEMSLEGSAAIARVAEHVGGMADQMSTPDEQEVQQVPSDGQQAHTNPPVIDRCAEVTAQHSHLINHATNRQYADNAWAGMSELERGRFMNDFAMFFNNVIYTNRTTFDQIVAQHC